MMEHTELLIDKNEIPTEQERQIKDKEMVLPCKGCLLVPLCKHRHYRELFEHCSLLKEYIPLFRHMHIKDEVYFGSKKVKLLHSTLHSTRWTHNGANRIINR